jgi:hypothetical protein
LSLDLGDLVGRISLDASSFDSTIDGLPGKLKGSGAVMAGGAAVAGGLVAAALGKGLSDAINLDTSNNLVAAQLGLSAEESARVGSLAGKLYADNYGESVEQVQQSIGNVVTGIQGMGTASDAEVSKMTAKVLNYSSAFSVESADAIQMVSGLMGSGLATSAENAMDLMTSAMQSVPEALRGDMTDAITEYAPFMASLGMDGEEAFGVLASASEKGMYGIDKTGDALKEFTIRATDMSKASAEGYDAMGMSQEDMTAKLLAGGDTAATAFADIVHGLQGIEDPTAQASAALALFGTPLEDLGVTEIPNFLGSIDPMGDAFDSVAGAADAMGETLGSGPAAQMEVFTRTSETLMASLMAGLLPAITAVFSYLNENPAVVQAIAMGLGILALAFVGVTVATWAMNTALLANPITWIILGVVALIGALVLLIANWDTVVTWLQGAWGGFVTWFTGLMDGLLGWWGGLWDGFLSGIQDGWGSIMGWFASIPGALGDFFGAAGSWLLAGAAALLGGLLTGVKNGWEAVGAWFASIPEMIGKFFASVGQWLLDVGKLMLKGLATGLAIGVVAIWFFYTQLPIKILGLLITAATWLVNTGKDLLGGLGKGIAAGYVAVSNWFKALPERVLSFLTFAATLLISIGRDLLGGFRRGIVWGYEAVVDWFVALPQRVLNFVVFAATLLVSIGKDLLDGLQKGIGWGWKVTTEWFTQLPVRLLNFVMFAGALLVSVGKMLLDGFQKGITWGWEAVVAFFTNVPPLILSFLIFAATLLITTGRDLLDGMQRGITDGWNAVSSFVQGIPGAIMAMLSGAGSWLVSAGTSALDGLRTGVSNGWNGVWSFITGIPGAISSAFSGAASWLSTAGGNIVDGLLGGLRSKASSVGKFFLDLLPGWIVGPFKSALGIASPSKVFAGFGMNIGEGLIGGIDGIQGDLDRRVSEMVTVPPVDVALRLGSAAATARGFGVSDTGVFADAPTSTVDARVYIAGDVGWNREELEAESNQRQTDALALAGLGTVGI